MQNLATKASTPSLFPADRVERLHHFAWRCRDAEQTRAFYEDLLGLPLAHVIRAERVPSTGEYCPYVHLFFQLADHSYIAFFDLGDGQSASPSANTPAWVNHIAFKVPSLEVLGRFKERLQSAGVEVIGITDHGFVRSIYFFDPNGVRLELTVAMNSEQISEAEISRAHAALDAWTKERRALGALSASPVASRG